MHCKVKHGLRHANRFFYVLFLEGNKPVHSASISCIEFGPFYNPRSISGATCLIIKMPSPTTYSVSDFLKRQLAINHIKSENHLPLIKSSIKNSISIMDIVYHNGTNGSSPWVDFYPYTPSASAGYTFMGLFGVATVAHFIFIFLFRAPYFLPMIIGGICASSQQSP